MTSSLPDLFDLMRNTILQTASTRIDASPFTPAYLFAWASKVYPLHDDDCKCHQGYENCFTVTKGKMAVLFGFLTTLHHDGNTVTFWQLEELFEAHLLEEWDRAMLMDACRYLYLTACFPQAFWQAMLRFVSPESEPHTIHQPLTPTELYGCHLH